MDVKKINEHSANRTRISAWKRGENLPEADFSPSACRSINSVGRNVMFFHYLVKSMNNHNGALIVNQS